MTVRQPRLRGDSGVVPEIGPAPNRPEGGAAHRNAAEHEAETHHPIWAVPERVRLTTRSGLARLDRIRGLAFARWQRVLSE